MQTVLGSGGQIAEELTRELGRNFTDDIRLVSRNPRKVHDTDQLVPADLMDADATDRAVARSDIVYLTVGLPMDAGLWEQRFPTMMTNTIAACRKHGSRLVFFDNTYIYRAPRRPRRRRRRSSRSAAKRPCARRSPQLCSLRWPPTRSMR